jgi:hypothetical protein
LGRIGTPSDVAKVICFLAAAAASYLAGEMIEINCGMFMDEAWLLPRPLRLCRFPCGKALPYRST